MPVAPWTPVAVAGRRDRRASARSRPGLRATLGVRGGFDVPSRTSAAARRSRSAASAATRAGPCVAGDVLRRRSAPSADAGTRRAAGAGHGARARQRRGSSACSSGRTPRPSSSRRRGSTRSCGAEWEVHFNSARTGVRLVGPRPAWARRRRRRRRPAPVEHPRHRLRHRRGRPHRRHAGDPRARRARASAASCARPWSPPRERWKLGQLRPATVSGSCRGRPRRPSATEQRRGVARPCHRPIEPVARPAWNAALSAGSATRPATRVLGASTADRRRRPGVTYRRAGDRFLLVEYGADGARPRAAAARPALDRWVQPSTSARRRRRHRRRPLAARPGRRRPADRRAALGARARWPRPSSATLADEPFAVPDRAPAAVVGRPADPRGDRALHARRARRRAVVPVEHRVHPPHQRPRRRRRRPPDRVRRLLPRARPRRRLPRRAGGHAARSPPPPRHDEVQPGADVDAGERRRHRRCLPLHLRHGRPRRLPVRRAHGAACGTGPAGPRLRPRAVAAATVRPAPLVHPVAADELADQRARQAAGDAGVADRAVDVPPGRAPVDAGRRRRRDRRVPRPPAGGVRRRAAWPGSRAASTERRDEGGRCRRPRLRPHRRRRARRHLDHAGRAPTRRTRRPPPSTSAWPPAPPCRSPEPPWR